MDLFAINICALQFFPKEEDKLVRHGKILAMKETPGIEELLTEDLPWPIRR